jgi:hypothetical protein
MNSVVDFLKRTSDRNGFNRERFEERKIPTDFSNVCILPFFGDLRSTCILSSLILHRYRQEVKSSRYFILASWPGFQGLFPYVDEYWAITDNSHIKNFYEKSEGFLNKSDLNTVYTRNLNEFFRDVINIKDLSAFYDDGLTSKFFDKFKDVKRFLPFISSSANLSRDFNKDLSTFPGFKVFLTPSVFIKTWNNGRSRNIKTNIDFWKNLVDYLLEKNYTPVIWNNYLTHDLSQEKYIGKCLFLNEVDISRVLSAMRATGFVLDVFNSVSKLSLLARCPYLCLDERSRYSNQKEYEIDDLFPYIPKNYIYTFSTILNEGTKNSWNNDIFNSIGNRIEEIIPVLDRDKWPSTGESFDIISYKDTVRKIKSKKMGTKFIQVIRD